MDATRTLEGEPTVPNREIIFEMLVRWRETVSHLAGVQWVPDSYCFWDILQALS